MGAGLVRDPYPAWEELRRRSPVFEGDANLIFYADDPFVAGRAAGIREYSVLSYDGVVDVFRDGTRFSSSCIADVLGPVLGRTILEMDDPEHRAYRALVQQAFSRKAMEQWQTEVIRPVVDAHIDAFARDGAADLVSQLTFSFPVHVIGGMLGIPKEDIGQFHRWAVEMLCIQFDVELGLAGSRRLAEYFAPLIAERREHRRSDVISDLVHAELDGQRLTDEEIISFLRFLLEAGAETTYRSSSNVLFGLLTHPDMLDALRSDRSLMPQTIEEGVRWEGPLTGLMRNAAVDTEIEGVPVPAGAIIRPFTGPANRDETRWDRPHEFDIFRDIRPHIGFAAGIHVCLGMHLARMETAVALDAVLDRLPDLRIDPAAEDVHISGSLFRAPRRLPVRFG
jgi:cytochrome P450